MPSPAGSRPALGVAFLVLAVACFAVLDTAVKYVGAFVPILVAVWFRYVFQAVAVTVVMLPLRGRRLLRTAHPRFQLLRGALLLTVSGLSFVAVQFMPVGEFTAFVMTTPLVVTLLAAVFLKERVPLARWALVGGASWAPCWWCSPAVRRLAGPPCCRWPWSSPTPGSRSSPAGWPAPKTR